MLIVEKMDILDLPLGVIKEDKIQSPDQVAKHLHLLVQRLKIENYPTAIALPIQSVIVKRIHLMKEISQKKIDRVIEENISRYFPGMTQELCYDYAILPFVDVLHNTALLVATRHEQLNDYITVIERAGLSIKIVDVDIYALARAMTVATAKECASSFVAMLDVSRCTTQCDVSTYTAQFIVFNSDDILFHQQFYYHDINMFYNKLKNAVHLCHSTHPLVKMNTLYFSGNAENMLSIIENVKQHIGMHVQYVNLFPSVIFSPSIPIEKIQILSPKMMQSFGLALRKIPQW